MYRTIRLTVSGLILSVACHTPAAHSASPPTASADLNPPSPLLSLKNQIDGILEKELRPFTGAGIKIISLKSGDTLYESNARLLQTAASNQKLFTAAAALALLGKNYPVTTEVSLSPGRPDLYLKGCGDSMLTSEDLKKLADDAAPALARDKPYTLSGDLSCFDDLYWGKGWMWDDEPDADEMYISPLSVNRNALRVRVTPGIRQGMPAVVSIDPPASQVKIDNRAVTAAQNTRNSIAVTRHPGDRENIVLVTGATPQQSNAVEARLSVWKPEQVAVGLFHEALRARGISVTVRGNAATPDGSSVIARKTRPVSEIVRLMLKKSDNLSAESLFKLMDHQVSRRPGTASGGSLAVRNHLESRNISPDRLVIADGSGVSRYNLTNAETIVSLLQSVYHDQDLFPLFYDALPIAGRDGTLAKRMKKSPAEGNLRAKTGTMSGVSALSGYLATADGELLAFSMIIQNFSGPHNTATGIQDQIAEILCRFRRK